MNRSLLAASVFAAFGMAAAIQPAFAQAAGDPVRPLVMLTQPQAASPQEFATAELIAAAWKQLGLQVTLRPLPGQQFSSTVWNERQRWDMTTWQMVGRPERSDPDELTYNLFVSANAATGFGFVGYKNPEYDALAQAQREELDPVKRQALVKQAQELINRDQPYAFTVHPKLMYALNKSVWDEKTAVVQSGLGIRNFWTWIGLTPLGAQKDIVLNSVAPSQVLNPFYIPGAQGSWVTELMWDRLMRVGPDGLPKPWAAESVTRPTPTTVDVVLREGMKWHDGSPVTIEDAVFSLEAPNFGNKAPMYKPFVVNIEKVETTGPRSLRITLKRPDAAFLVSTLSKLNLAPKKVWAPIFEEIANKPENIESRMETKILGSGPYKFVSAKLAEEIVLEANPDHWSAPKAGRWILRIVPNIEASLGALRRGEVNFLADYTGDPDLLRSTVKANPNLMLSESLDIGFRFIAMNLRRPPFDNAKFRVALSTLVDRETIAADAWGGQAVPANSWVSPALSFWHADGIVGRVPGGGTIETAKKLLAEAGFVLVNGRLHYPAGVKETTTPFQ